VNWKETLKAMRFLGIVKSAENASLGPPPPALLDAVAKLVEDGKKAGVLLETGGLLPSAMGSRLRLSSGKLSVTDGPFSEAKEVIGGFAIYEVKSKADMIEWTRRFMNLHTTHWPAWEGECEVRQLADFAG
jgi:hypothetical protein